MSIYSQLLVKILYRSDKEKTTCKAIEKYRYGLWKTVSKHLNDTLSVSALGYEKCFVSKGYHNIQTY